jgi:predicted peroxiredoxin
MVSQGAEPANLLINTAIPSATMAAMSTEINERSLLIKITCGAEAAERANQAWTVAAMGVAAGAAVSVWLTGEAVWFAVPGRQPDLDLPYATPVAELIETVRLGGSITVCTQCAARRELVMEDLVQSATIQGAASFVEAALGDNVQALVY